jgi:hypothetical protein
MASEMVKAAASDKLKEMDWAKNIEICELVARDPGYARRSPSLPSPILVFFSLLCSFWAHGELIWWICLFIVASILFCVVGSPFGKIVFF